MRVKILPCVTEVRDGVSRYAATLASVLRSLGIDVIDGHGDYDVLHLAEAHRYDPEWREAKRCGKRLVVTVHDLIPEHFNLPGPQYAGVAERREILAAADAVIAVSQHTKDDIVATYAVPADKIAVIHNGVSEGHSDAPSAAPAAPSPFLLWVGRRAGYKNFTWFVRAVAPLLWSRKFRVVCTGGQAFGRKERLLLAALGLSRRFEVVQADDAQLARLYRDAICLVMPSKAEGFGLPAVEAMANGCPAVIPRAHVFPEVAGDAAAYFEPDNGKMMRRAILRCLDPGVRGELISKGLERARKFSWRQCAEAVRRTYSATAPAPGPVASFSVIIPVRNAAPYLGACLDSVMAAAKRAEGRATVEIICIDDGSTDGSAAILSEYASRIGSFKLIRQAKAGPGPARNAGLSKATGERVVFVDADDTLEADAFTLLSEFDADIVTFLPPAGKWNMARPSDRRFLFSPLVGNLIAWNAAYRRTAIGNVRFPGLTNYEDLVFACGVFARANTVVAGVKPWYRHVVRPSGVTSIADWHRVREGFLSRGLMCKALKGSHVGICTRLILARKMAMHVLLHAIRIIPQAAVGPAAKALGISKRRARP